jgi:Fe-S oxidoreductase
MKIAKKAVLPILNSKPDVVASDCPLSALQLDQAGATPTEKGHTTNHPIQIIRDAYGHAEE